MTCDLVALTVGAREPARAGRFWADLLRGELTDDAPGSVAVEAGEDLGFRLRFVPSDAPRTGLNQMHFHLTSTSAEDQQATVARALGLGAAHLDVGQRPEEGHVVLADPEGNEFCVIEPGNKWLADCGFFAEVTCEGSQETGYFWRDALGWPLVWDQDQETAIRSPHGGPKISWGGPPLSPQTGQARMHFDLAAAERAADAPAELERLLSLGATRSEAGQREVGWVVLADPDGHEFCLRSLQ